MDLTARIFISHGNFDSELEEKKAWLIERNQWDCPGLAKTKVCFKSWPEQPQAGTYLGRVRLRLKRNLSRLAGLNTLNIHPTHQDIGGSRHERPSGMDV
jgi:hypothetical protein